jgi:EAL domain-containing protein (putative c-di-GMP-specific phosphodiesterase class I)
MKTTAACTPELGNSPGVHDWTLSGRLTEDGDLRSIVLHPLPVIIGRRTGLSMTLLRETVSGLHAKIFARNQRLFVQDLDSTNGTFLNGIRVLGEQELFHHDLIQFADAAFRVVRQAPDVQSHTRHESTGDQALALVQFDHMLSQGALTPYFQPIIDLATSQAVAYEALVRSRFVGLETPDSMFAAARQLGLVTEFSQFCRRESLEKSGQFRQLPHLFLNTHPSEVTAESFLDSCAHLRQMTPMQPITIEIHEAAMTQVAAMVDVCRSLEALEISVAFDDFGAGQARIAELVEVRPRYVKFDRSLVHGLHGTDSSRRRVVSGLVATVRNIGIIPLAEGIETQDEAVACVELGFLLAQGFLYGNPMPATHYA